MHHRSSGCANREESSIVMRPEDVVLQGAYIRLEPLALLHVDGLVAASSVDASLYQWSPVPQGEGEAVK